MNSMFYSRFANSFLNPLLNRTHVEDVQITMAEEFGIQGRGAFYDQTGTLRDVVQNHLFQVLANLTMEPPVRTDSESIRSLACGSNSPGRECNEAVYRGPDLKQAVPRNVAASVRQRLLNIAHRDGSDFAGLLTRYALERLLYRLGGWRYRDQYVLKGAMLFPCLDCGGTSFNKKS